MNQRSVTIFFKYMKFKGIVCYLFLELFCNLFYNKYDDTYSNVRFLTLHKEETEKDVHVTSFRLSLSFLKLENNWVLGMFLLKRSRNIFAPGVNSNLDF